VVNDGSLTMTNVVAGDHASQSPVISNAADSIMTLTNLTVANNGGTAIYNIGGDLVLVNGTIANNGYGVDGFAQLTNVTFNGNYRGAVNWSGIRANKFVRNTIFVSHPTSGHPNCLGSGYGGFYSLGGNIDNDNSCPLDAADLRNTDPRLGPLQNNGGDVPTMALLADSPAVDWGVNADCPATDARGVARPVNGSGQATARCDSGAYEYVPPPLAATRTPTPTPTFTPTATPTPVDSTPPSITSFTINGGAAATTSASVTLSITATDNRSGVTEMSFANDGTTWGGWLPFAPTATWTLTSGDGPKTVSARVRDRDGNISPVATANIALDAAAGTDDGVSINQGAVYTNSTAVNLTIGARPNTSQMQVSNDGGFAGAQWEPYASRKPWQLTQHGATTIPRLVYVKYRDLSGTVSGIYQDNIVLDVTAPTGSVAVQGGSAAPRAAGRAPTAMLTLQAADDLSGVESMRLSNRGDFAGAQWEPYAASKQWDFDNANTVYVQYRDRAGNVSAAYSTTLGSSPQATPTLAPSPTLVPDCTPRPPVTVTSTPSGGTLQVTITAQTSANARLGGLRFTSFANASVEGIPGHGTLTTPQTVVLPNWPASLTFTMRRLTPGQAATVNFVVGDSCGEWPTLVGGGPRAI
jgi:hypothetical protein